MRILFLSQVLPYPLDAGPKMRSYFVLKHLVKQHEVTLLTFVRDSDQPEYITHLKEICDEVHTIPMQRNRLKDLGYMAQSVVTGQPFLIIRDQVAAMTSKINELVSRTHFDTIQADQLWMAQYALIAKKGASQAKLVLDQHNAVYLIPQRMAKDENNAFKKLFLWGESKRLASYEVNIWREFDHVVWVTAEDRQAVSQLNGSTQGYAPSTVIPICADPEHVEPIEPVSPARRVTFLGGLHWPPNAQGILWFAREVFPRVRAAVPEAILTVIGKNPPAGLEGPGVEVTGYVVDPKPYLAETGVFIVPLHAGGGMRVKILDAWSWGLPMVSTTIGAEGIETNPGTDILIADEAESFARAVVQVLTDPALAQTLRQQGRETVRQKYNWQLTYAAWEEIYAAT